jgi:hypothetical protein
MYYHVMFFLQLLPFIGQSWWVELNQAALQAGKEHQFEVRDAMHKFGNLHAITRVKNKKVQKE